jgi:phosphopantothenate---cysteine ligase (CTP)
LPATLPKMLVTAGNTLTPIDSVRGITNVFTGRTGARIAAQGTVEGFEVELLTSQPGVVEDTVVDYSRLTLTAYQTFDDLAELMEERVRLGGSDVVVHSAAVSDYHCAAVFEPAPLSEITDEGTASSPSGPLFQRVDASQKISSRHSELWLRLLPTPKLVDQIRRPWGFTGILVEFKLEVGVSDEVLIHRAQAALSQSEADLVVANTFESMHDSAFFVFKDAVESIDRSRLPTRLIGAINKLRQSRQRST